MAWVAARSASQGKANVYLDGVFNGTVDLYSSTSQSRRVVYSLAVPPGNHTLKVKVTGAENPAATDDRLDDYRDRRDKS